MKEEGQNRKSERKKEQKREEKVCNCMCNMSLDYLFQTWYIVSVEPPIRNIFKFEASSLKRAVVGCNFISISAFDLI